MRINLHFLALISLIFLFSSSIDAVCQMQRVRKSWDSMTPVEKRVYLDAVSEGMRRGYHILFTSIHVDGHSELEAHQTCGFLMWHRRFLLAYENMLRSLDKRFECVTIPYWNYFNHYAMYTEGKCNSIYSCSRIARDFGGSQGTQRAFSVLKNRLSGSCVSSYPSSSFCQDSARGTQCEGCIFRGDWNARGFPTIGYASMASIISRVTDYSNANINIQNSPHNDIHNALGGLMGLLLSPADFIFYSHHATIDMLHHLFFECHVGKDTTDEWKKTNLLAYQGCTYIPGLKSPSAVSDVYMYLEQNGQRFRADQHPQLAPFFRSIGTSYFQFVDSFSFGNQDSYTYQMGDVISVMVASGLTCSSTANRRLTANSTQVVDRIGRQSAVEGCLPDPDGVRPSVKKYKKWIKAAMELAKASSCSTEEAIEQVELMECVHHNETSGTIPYSESFLASFQPKHPMRCNHLISEIEKGNKKIVVPDWRSAHEKIYGKKPC